MKPFDFTTRTHRLRKTALIVAAHAGLYMAAPALAQQAAIPPQGRPEATRAELEALVQQQTEQANAIGISAADKNRLMNEVIEKRERLREGDFRVGDRIIMIILAPLLAAKVDTLTVRANALVDIPRLDTISLKGVLTSEVDAALIKKLSVEFTAPRIRTERLMSVLVSGAVGQQSVVNTPSDALLNEVIMGAGGPTNEADLKRVHVLRGDRTLYKQGSLSTVSYTSTLDQLGIRSGDEIIVGRRSSGRTLTILSTTAAVVSILAGLYGATQLFR